MHPCHRPFAQDVSFPDLFWLLLLLITLTLGSPCKGHFLREAIPDHTRLGEVPPCDMPSDILIFPP